MKLLFGLLFLVVFEHCISQNKHVQVFQYLMNTQIAHQKVRFTLYYIVDSSIVYRYGKLSYYGFTFSEDSLEHTGFIGYNKYSEDILYISDTTGKKKNLSQKIFGLKDSRLVNISFFPYLGAEIKMNRKVVNNKIIFSPLYSFPRDSHSIFIKQLEFEKGKLFPNSIVFSFPFEDEESIKITAVPIIANQ
jgi:hypothetical protein